MSSAFDDALRAFGLEEEVAAPLSRSRYNGHGFTLTCFGCGKEFESNRRQLPDHRAWCPECKAAKKPAAQRARDFRLAHGGK